MPPRTGGGRIPGDPSLRLINRDSEQTHLLLGVRTPGRNWEQRWATAILNGALGGGLSSRLFQEIRETRGLAYSVYSAVDSYCDTGTLSVYAGCQPERFAEVVEVTRDVHLVLHREVEPLLLGTVAHRGVVDVKVTHVLFSCSH